MTSTPRAVSAMLMCTLIVSGCHYVGSGSGLLRAPVSNAPGGVEMRGPVAFRWEARADATRGTIEAKLPDGRDFTGTYAQPVSSEWRDDYNLYWGAWTGPWGRARPWYNGPRSSFVTHYSIKALAHLTSANGERMRCEFELFDASAGLTGGGQGECQLSTNEDVFGAVLKRDN